MGRGDGRGRGQLRPSQPEVAAQPQNFGKEDGAPTAVAADHDAITARAAWLETIRVMARCMAQQDHARMMREEDASRD
jgi:hypothetical protein